MTKKATPRLDALFQRVERLCKNKAALARFLGVSSSHIQKWITAREYEPGGEITLRLLEWVTAEEGKTKNAPGSARNTARSKTRSTQSIYEKRKSGPRKG